MLVTVPPVVVLFSGAAVLMVPPTVLGRYRLVWLNRLYSSARNSTLIRSTGVLNRLFTSKSVW